MEFATIESSILWIPICRNLSLKFSYVEDANLFTALLDNHYTLVNYARVKCAKFPLPTNPIPVSCFRNVCIDLIIKLASRGSEKTRRQSASITETIPSDTRRGKWRTITNNSGVFPDFQTRGERIGVYPWLPFFVAPIVDNSISSGVLTVADSPIPCSDAYVNRSGGSSQIWMIIGRIRLIYEYRNGRCLLDEINLHYTTLSRLAASGIEGRAERPASL